MIYQVSSGASTDPQRPFRRSQSREVMAWPCPKLDSN